MREKIVILACFIACSMQGYSQQDKIRELKSLVDEGKKSIDAVRPENKKVSENYIKNGGELRYVVPPEFQPVPLQRFLKPDGQGFFDALSRKEKDYYIDLAGYELEKAENKKSTKPVEDELSSIILKNLGIKLNKEAPGNMLASKDAERLGRWAGKKYKEKTGNIISSEVLNQVLVAYERLLPSYEDKMKIDENSGRAKEAKRLQEISDKLHAWCPECGKK